MSKILGKLYIEVILKLEDKRKCLHDCRGNLMIQKSVPPI